METVLTLITLFFAWQAAHVLTDIAVEIFTNNDFKSLEKELRQLLDISKGEGSQRICWEFENETLLCEVIQKVLFDMKDKNLVLTKNSNINIFNSLDNKLRVMITKVKNK